MRNLLKIAVLGLAFSGLVACSSAQKEEDSVLADLAQSESTVENTDIMDTTESTMTESNFVDTEEDSSSLGTGSSGLGH